MPSWGGVLAGLQLSPCFWHDNHSDSEYALHILVALPMSIQRWIKTISYHKYHTTNPPQAGYLPRGNLWLALPFLSSVETPSAGGRCSGSRQTLPGLAVRSPQQLCAEGKQSQFDLPELCYPFKSFILSTYALVPSISLSVGSLIQMEEILPEFSNVKQLRGGGLQPPLPLSSGFITVLAPARFWHRGVNHLIHRTCPFLTPAQKQADGILFLV